MAVVGEVEVVVVEVVVEEGEAGVLGAMETSLFFSVVRNDWEDERGGRREGERGGRDRDREREGRGRGGSIMCDVYLCFLGRSSTSTLRI